KDRVFGPVFGEQVARCNQAGDIVGLGRLQNSGHVVIDTMAQGVNTGFKTAEGAAQERSLDPLFYCGSIESYGPTSGDAHASDALGIDLRSRFKIIQGADHIPGPPARHSL